MNFENTIIAKQKRMDEERKLRSDAINRYLFEDNLEIEMLKSRLLLSSMFNFVCLFGIAVYALVQAVKGW